MRDPLVPPGVLGDGPITFDPLSVLTPEQYEAMFPEINVDLNWAAFKRDRWPVRTEIITDPARLRTAFTCFRSSLGRVDPHFLHWLFARNMAIFEVERRYRSLRAADQVRSDRFERLFRDQGYAKLAIPVFDLGNGRFYLLDGNHRCLALCRSGVPFKVDVYAIVGPVTATASVDLVRCRDGLFSA